MRTHLPPIFERLDSRMLLSAGDFDPAFNNGALLKTAFDNGSCAIADVKALPDGGMIAAGTIRVRNGSGLTGHTLLSLVKYKFDGSLDTTFGAGGKIAATPRNMAGGFKLQLTPDGGFIVMGYGEFPGIAIVLIEDTQFQSTVVSEIMRDYPSVPVKGVSADGDKRTRAASVAAKYIGRKVWHHASLRDSDFERELLSFNPPKGHDDMVDAEGYSFGLGSGTFFYGKMGLHRPTPQELGIIIPGLDR